MTTTEKLLRKLPPDLQQEVEDFAEFLLERHAVKPREKMRLDWAGGLREYRDKYTSVGLQHKVLEWWGD